MHRRVPPPLLLLLAGLAMALTDRLLPGAAIDLGVWRWLIAPLVLGALTLMALALLEFRRHATTVDPRRPERSAQLIARGIYRVSRNPIYLADVLLLLAWAVHVGNLLALGWVVVFVVVLQQTQIAAEEAALAQRFGESYAAYRRQVRRWI